MSKFKIEDRVTVNDRKMKVNDCNGKVIGIEPNTDKPVYNVLVELKDKDGKATGKSRMINFLETQITKEIESV